MHLIAAATTFPWESMSLGISALTDVICTEAYFFLTGLYISSSEIDCEDPELILASSAVL